MSKADRCQKVMELAKRRGFFWPSYELYGGESGFIDYGPLGAVLKRKIEEKWVETFVRQCGLMLIDTPILTPSAVFEASGHTTHFTDPITTCKNCGRKWRADHLLEDQANISGEGLSIDKLEGEMRNHGVHCPECKGELEPPKIFNELFRTTIGPYSDHIGYGRPETAQGIFSNFRRLYELARNRLPFGVAQVGRCVRNEISPRQGPVRLRELTIMEFEFFFDPETAECERLQEVEDEKIRLLHEEAMLKGLTTPIEVTVKDASEKGYIKSTWNAYFMALARRFIEELGIPADKQFFREKLPSERAHYSAQTYDQVVELSRWGFVEVSGHAWRTDYDLRMHMAHSGEDLRVYAQHEKPEKTLKLVTAPNKKKLAEIFGSEAALVSRLLELSPPEEIRESLEKTGFYDLRSDGKKYRVLSEHVDVREVTVEEKGRRFIPSVVEPSFGSDRLVYAVLDYAYTEKEDRVVLRLPKDLAPVEVAVFPLLSKDDLPAKAEEVCRRLVDEGFRAEYDEAGSIGKRYARVDEAGVPLAVTVDYRTMEDNTVTLRDRDSWRQVRVKVENLPSVVRQYLDGKIGFNETGETVG